jgi:hypothetical protein
MGTPPLELQHNEGPEVTAAQTIVEAIIGETIYVISL